MVYYDVTPLAGVFQRLSVMCVVSLAGHLRGICTACESVEMRGGDVASI